MEWKVNIPIGLTFPKELNKNFAKVFFNIGKHTNWVSQTLLDLMTETIGTNPEKIRTNNQRNLAIKVHKTLKEISLFIFLIFLM